MCFFSPAYIMSTSHFQLCMLNGLSLVTSLRFFLRCLGKLEKLTVKSCFFNRYLPGNCPIFPSQVDASPAKCRPVWWVPCFRCSFPFWRAWFFLCAKKKVQFPMAVFLEGASKLKIVHQSHYYSFHPPKKSERDTGNGWWRWCFHHGPCRSHHFVLATILRKDRIQTF